VQPQRKERLDNLENEDRDNNSISELLRTPRQPNPWPNEALGRFSARGTPKKHQDPLDKAGSFREVAPNAFRVSASQRESNLPLAPARSMLYWKMKKLGISRPD
jgi:hypothetical protein